MIPNLVDIITRHQIYLDGVKSSEAIGFNVVLQKLNADLRLMLGRLNVKTLDQFTRRELQSFLSELRQRQATIYNAYQADLIRFLQAFMRVDLDVISQIYETKTDTTLEQADKENDHNSLYGLLAVGGTAVGIKRLWGIIANTPIPANGVMPQPFINSFTSNSAAKVSNAIVRGYANGWTIEQTLVELSGTKERNFRDGELARIGRAADAVQSTIIQHVSALTNAGVASVFYDRYRWISILDAATTDICKSRANHIYYYSTGPQPPAHINCRSRTVPLTGDSNDDGPAPTFAVWVNKQPAQVKNDALNIKPLTLAQFKSKVLTQALEA